MLRRDLPLVGRFHHPLQRLKRRHRLARAGDQECELTDW
jgi:hypothetical protein